MAKGDIIITLNLTVMEKLKLNSVKMISEKFIEILKYP